MDISCRVCGGHHTGKVHEVREMMQGLRTCFHYAQCVECDSLWLIDPPADFTPYYSNGYYSFADDGYGITGHIKGYLRAKRDMAYFGKGGRLGRFLRRHFEDGALSAIFKSSVSQETGILDVGCGSGTLLHRLAALGFTHLSGVDPFLSIENSNGSGVEFRRAHLEDVNDRKYGLVMFHHSLEHVADPGKALRAAAGLLTPWGKCLVRLPVLGEAWEKYGTNWVQLCAPRHMWIATEKAMIFLAKFSGLRIEKTEYDSTAFQFWGSELYQRDISLNGVVPYDIRARLLVRNIKEFRRRAAFVNRQGRGDQAVFLLVKEREIPL